MSREGIARTILAIVVGYIANAMLVVVTEELLSVVISGTEARPPLDYFVIDLITQCGYTMVGGYLCRLIARTSWWPAMAGLIGLGMLVGTVSLVAAWKTEPHWYAIALLLVYPPCVWIGWSIKQSQIVAGGLD